LRLPESTAATVSLPSSIAFADRLRQRTRVADAGRAAVADDVEAERVECGLHAGLVEVLRTTFEPGASEVFTHGLVVSPLATAFCASRPAASITLGLLVLVQLVIAAITTAPS
jgi:hypothetical protein